MRAICGLLLLVSGVLLPSSEAVAQPPGRPGGQPGERVEPEDLEFRVGAAKIPDRETYEKFSYRGYDIGRDPYLANLQYVKFIIENIGTKDAKVYWMNTKNYRGHPPYMRMVGINSRGAVRGALTFHPQIKNPSGGAGLYVYDFQPNNAYSFEEIQQIQETLLPTIPFIKGKIAFHPLRGNMPRYEAEKEKYDASDIAVHHDGDLYKNIVFLPLNSAESFGLLRIMENDARPSPRDIVIYKTLPNQMPRVAGVITEERQTPLSHVNLRAVQDKIPNAYISEALGKKEIQSLVGKLVRFSVTPKGYTLREATREEVDTHFAKLRPAEAQTPPRDLSQKKVLSLKEIGFKHSTSYGVKSANIATMHTFNFPEGLIPEGHAVPFYFYDEFMKHNGFYKKISEALNSEAFQQADREARFETLQEIREMIEQGHMPDALMEELSQVQKSFAEGTSIRCRSSTNNEDLPGFSGAGLYDSFTHKPDEGHLSKSIKQVYASLWNDRAFEEREFYRIDHLQTAMGVLLHPNQKEEQANGVAVTTDILYDTDGNYYLNTQVGEDLVTNPDAESSPEEILLGWYERDGHEIVRRSAAVKPDQQILSDEHLSQLRNHLARIHARFQKLYEKGDEEPFAMEIEFKITKDGKLQIKQARPWVY